MRKLTLAMASAVVATGGIALAAPAIAQQADMTRAEVQAKAGEHFAKMDANSDGVLNAADREARRGQMFDKLDSDNNGAISEAEFNARREARKAARGERAGDHAGHAGMDASKHHGMRGHRMGGRGGMWGRMAMARMADTNNDRAISRAEFDAAVLKHFDAADADDNGTVTAAERKAAHEKMRAQWQARRAAQPAT